MTWEFVLGMKVTVPRNRISPLKANWMQIYEPVTQILKLDMRMNLKTMKVIDRDVKC